MESPTYVRIFKIYRRWAIVLGKALGKTSQGRGGGWGSSLGILGWRRAAGSLEPLAYTRSGLLPIPELVQLYFATLYYPKFPKFLLS